MPKREMRVVFKGKLRRCFINKKYVTGSPDESCPVIWNFG